MRAAFVLSALALAACGDPYWGIHGNVRTAADARCRVEGRAGAAGAPLSDVAVSITCPSGAAQRTIVTTKADGAFTFSEGGAPNPACRVVLSKPGYRAQSFSIAELCTEESFAGCHSLTIVADLQPEM